MRGQTSPFECVWISIVGSTLASVSIFLSFPIRPVRGGLSIVNVWPVRGPVRNVPRNDPGTNSTVKVSSARTV